MQGLRVEPYMLSCLYARSPVERASKQVVPFPPTVLCDYSWFHEESSERRGWRRLGAQASG